MAQLRQGRPWSGLADQQTIYVGVQYCGEIVSALLEDEWFRVLFEAHPIAATPRQHRPGASRIYGTDCGVTGHPTAAGILGLFRYEGRPGLV